MGVEARARQARKAARMNQPIPAKGLRQRTLRRAALGAATGSLSIVEIVHAYARAHDVKKATAGDAVTWAAEQHALGANWREARLISNATPDVQQQPEDMKRVKATVESLNLQSEIEAVKKKPRKAKSPPGSNIAS